MWQDPDSGAKPDLADDTDGRVFDDAEGHAGEVYDLDGRSGLFASTHPERRVALAMLGGRWVIVNTLLPIGEQYQVLQSDADGAHHMDWVRMR